MANMFDYLTWRGDLSFQQSPFNPVDNIILSQFSYFPLDNIVPGPDAEGGVTIGQMTDILTEGLRYDASLRQKLIYKEDSALLGAIGSSARFRNCEMRGFINHIDVQQEKQIAALCVNTGDGSSFVVYRGTDATLVGWKEDFNMSFSDTVPSQLEAVSYLEKMAKKIRGPLRLGGHSKGGNLAVYAAACCDMKTSSRIEAIYSNDAPGFQRQIIESSGFRRIRGRIYSFVPQSSIIGMLFEHDDDYTVVKSSRTGILQHEMYSWEVTHNDMVRLEAVNQESRFVDKTLREWINGLDYAQRERFTDFLFSLLGSAQAASFTELTADWFKTAGLMLRSLQNIDSPTRNLMGKTLGALFRAARNNLDTLLTQKPNAKESQTPKKIV